MNRPKFAALLTTLCLAMPTAQAADTVQVVNCSIAGNFTITNNVVTSSSTCAGVAIIPDSVTTIGVGVFQGSNSLTSLTIGNSVTTIGEYAFYDATSLTSLTIPNSVTTIGSQAFVNATSLTSLTIGSSVTTIGEFAFSGATSLTSFTVEIANSKYSSDVQGVLYNKEKTVLIQAPLAKSTIIIPSTVVLINAYAFNDAKSLATLVIPKTVQIPGAGLIYDLKAAVDKAAVDKLLSDAKSQSDKLLSDAKAQAEKIVADAKATAAAATKKTTITCIKGKLTKKVTVVNPKCPTGYKKK